MLGVIIGVTGIAWILLLSELLWRKKVISAEYSRKFVHILTGTFIAFWPFMMDFWVIQLLSFALLAVVFLSMKVKLFKSIHGVPRQTYGEVLFPLGIAIAATFAQSEWVYAAAILHLSLADGFAAVVGSRHIKKHGYKILGQYKTIVGTFVFYMISLSIIVCVVVFDSAHFQPVGASLIFWLPIAATIIENIAVYGTDNVLVPLLIIGVLNSLQTVA
jgi:phytol kinase